MKKYENQKLPDIYYVLFIIEQHIGNHKIKTLKLGLHSFNEQCFYSEGEKYKENVLEYEIIKNSIIKKLI